MAARRSYSRANSRYTQTGTGRSTSGMYVYGNTVAKPAYEPDPRNVRPEKPRRKASSQVRRNRRQAMHMNPAYVIFLAVAAVAALVICINYIQLQSAITEHSKTITAMQEELADLKEENTTRENAVLDSVNLDEVRERAQNELGMVYASQDQIVNYEDPATDYVKQYEDIPESGVLAQSDNNAG
nr:hypothetical protein [uncultured Merdimonas sp.]